MGRKAIFIIFISLVVLISGCSPSKSISVAVPEPVNWPTTSWQASSPEAQGMDSVLLAQMLEEANANQTRIHSLLIIRNGTMVTEAYFHPYTPDKKIHLQSVTKSIIGALVGIAVKEGYIKDAHESMLSFFPNRRYANPSQNKDAITLKHLLSMSSGFPCQEFTDSGQSMEQSMGWVQFMLDLPVETAPGETFGYCDGNPHLLSAIIEKTTGMPAREYANQKLFAPLGIPAVPASDWWVDPQGYTDGGYGLFLTPADLAKIALLYLQNGIWEGQQILPKDWVSASTTQYIQKPEGPGYGYLWTVYPNLGRYSALGLGGQQIHVYPAKNLVVIVTAELETFVEAPEIEGMLNDYILPSIKSNSPLADNPQGVTRLQLAVETAANPVQAVPQLPEIAGEISGKLYKFEENPFGWQSAVFYFEPGAATARVVMNGGAATEEIGLDNIYRLGLATSNLMMRGHWVDAQTFLIEWLPEDYINGTTAIQLKYTGTNLEVSVQPVIFSGQPTVFKGTQ